MSNVNEKMRRRLMWVSLSILLVLAGVEVALAVMRDLIVTQDLALKQSLSSAKLAVPIDTSWVTRIPTAGQMILGFTLPFALAFVAIPLEYFVQSSRTVIGAGLVVGIRALALVLRALGSTVRQLGNAICLLYDAVIFAPLLVERAVLGMRAATAGEAKAAEISPFTKRTATTEPDRSATGGRG